MIILDKISKVYRTGFFYNRVSAAQDVSFRVKKGEVFGFIGANGTGKTTIIKVILSLSPPTSGKGTLMGYPLGDYKGRVNVGYLPENPYFPHEFKIWDYLCISARLKNIPKDRIDTEVSAKLKKLGMYNSRHLTFGECSKGMVQRTGLAFALLGGPQLLILDEPMSGLDPRGRFEVQKIIRREREKGHTVFFSSHIMADIEQVCDRVGLMVNGNLKGVLPASEFVAESESDLIDVQLKSAGSDVIEKLKALDPNLVMTGDNLFMTLRGHGGILKLLELLGEDYKNIVSIMPHHRGLERHFYKKAGENISENNQE